MLFGRFPFYGVHIRSKTDLTSGVIKDFHFPWFTLSHPCLPVMVVQRREGVGANGVGGADVGGSGGGGATFGGGGGQLSNDP